MNDNLQKAFLEETRLLLEPIVAASQSAHSRRVLFRNIGWDLDLLPGFPIDELTARFTEFANSFERLCDLLENPPETFSEFLEALDKVDQLYAVIRKLPAIVDQPGFEAPPQLDALGTDLITYLVTNYLETRHPTLHDLLLLLTIIRFREDGPLPGAIVDGSGNMVRFPHRMVELRLERIADLLADPLGVLKAEYLESDSLATSEHAKHTADQLFPRLGRLLQTLGANAMYSIKPEYGFDFGEAGNELGSGMLTAFVDPDLEESSFGVTLALSSADRGGLGLVVAPFGNFEHSQTLDSWLIAIGLTASEAFAVSSRGPTFLSGATSIRGEFQAIKIPEAEDSVFRLGSTAGTRLEVGSFQITGELDLREKQQDVTLLLEVGSATLVVAPGDGDGFLRQILPPDGLRTDFDLALGWSNRKGFYFRGSAGLEATLPVHTSLLGILSVDSVYLEILAPGDNVHTVVAATASTQLGPIKAVVERVGLEATFAFPPEGGNLGPVDMALAFKPPDSLGLLIDAGSVVGGGFLFFDPDNEEYGGILQLEFNSITLSAVGLLTTRMPDGSEGFSLVVIVTAAGFTPINLGFGFTLNGVGGLLGVNRTVAVDVLRAGIKNRSLDSVLFPEDPVRNAPQIISDLGTVFPPARDQYVFGPMALIGWGTPTVLTIELGVILEFPSPLRLIALGQFRALLPSEEKVLVRLQMDALGEVNFDKGEASIDATLYDSRVLQYPLTGDMALRARWSTDPTFVLAVGGLNLRFQPPPGFPMLERLAISLTTGDNPRLRLEAYLALTSNTVQIGARLDFYAATDIRWVGRLSIEGYLGFDTLFQFSPFQFIADINAGVALKRGGSTLMSVQLDMVLSGPSPWHAKGKATFTVCRVSASVSFDRRIGGDERPPVLPLADPLPELLRMLGDRRNWSAQLPKRGHMLVSLREIPATTEVLVHPLGDLTVRQRVVPLNVTISKYGNTTPSGVRLFTISKALFKRSPAEEPQPVEAQPVKDYFAPAQYFEMGETEKLSRPSFERLQAGVSIGTEGVAYGDKQEANIQYDTRIVYVIGEENGVTREGDLYAVAAPALEATVGLGAAGRSAILNTGQAKYHAPGLGIVFDAPSFVVAATDDLTIKDIPGLDAIRGATYTETAEALRGYLADHPGEWEHLQVVRIHEAEGVTS